MWQEKIRHWGRAEGGSWYTSWLAKNGEDVNTLRTKALQHLSSTLPNISSSVLCELEERQLKYIQVSSRLP